MLPSASLGGAMGEPRKGLYEPIHGSAPDIAGRDVANPLACILSVAMMLRHSFDMEDQALMIERAVSATLARGIGTPDIAKPGIRPVTTTAMGDAVLEELGSIAG
jgi:3-isopropylmalate dehydrogenase